MEASQCICIDRPWACFVLSQSTADLASVLNKKLVTEWLFSILVLKFKIFFNRFKDFPHLFFHFQNTSQIANCAFKLQKLGPYFTLKEIELASKSQLNLQKKTWKFMLTKFFAVIIHQCSRFVQKERECCCPLKLMGNINFRNLQ